MYLFLIFLILSLCNVFVIWLLIELILLFFFLFVLNNENKNRGLIIYFFFQSFVSLLLFIVIFFLFDKLIFLFLIAKLGLFPFFYWVVVVRIKVGLISNMFILSLQKVSVFWILWLLLNSRLVFVYFLVYLTVFFVIVSLLIVTDLWLLLVYSSIGNTSMIVLRVYGFEFLFVVFLYLFIVLIIINLIKFIDSYIELLLLIFFFLVVPPFLLFFIKFYVILSLDFRLKIGFFLSIFDVLILLYYFSLIFIKFLLIDMSILIYIINFIIILTVLFFRNCVALIIFYKS